jgi:type IV pilus assembly protein PilQ
MFCTNCGKSIPDTANFCAFCGTANASSSASHIPASQPIKQSDPASKPTPQADAAQPPQRPPSLYGRQAKPEPSTSSWLTWLWYLLVFALFNLAGKNLADAIVGNGLLPAVMGVAFGALGIYITSAVQSKINSGGTRILVGIGIVVATFVLAIVGYAVKDYRKSATQQATVAAASAAQASPSQSLDDFTDKYAASHPKAQANADLKPFIGELDKNASPPQAQANASCIDGNSIAIPGGYTGKPISFNFPSVPIRTLLQLIAEDSGINLVASERVNGNITACVTNVPWDYALDTVLSNNGYSRREVGGVTYIDRQ